MNFVAIEGVKNLPQYPLRGSLFPADLADHPPPAPASPSKTNGQGAPLKGTQKIGFFAVVGTHLNYLLTIRA